MARHGGMAQLVVGCLVAAIALGIVTGQPSPPFTNNSTPPPPFTNNSTPPPPFTDNSPTSSPFTDNSPPSPPSTDSSPPSPPSTDNSTPPPPIIDNSPPPPPSTNNSPPPPPITDNGPSSPPFINNNPPPLSTSIHPPVVSQSFSDPPSFSPIPIDRPPSPPKPSNPSNPPPPPFITQKPPPRLIDNLSKPNLIQNCASGDDDSHCIMQCPDWCPRTCLFACSSCMVACRCDRYPGISCGDPSFTGGDGNTFYFHGNKDHHFCIFSDANLHINAHFIGNHNPAIKRNFTWIQAFGISFDDHRLYVGARKAVVWDEEEDHMEITFDGEPVSVDTENNARWMSKFHDGRLSVTRLDTINSITVELAGVFTISASAVPITDEDSRIHNYGKTGKDSLVHLDLRFKFHSLTDDVDGVLGQTYRPDYVNKMDVTVKMPIMGGTPKYLSSGLFSTDCAVSRFRHGDAAGRVLA